MKKTIILLFALCASFNCIAQTFTISQLKGCKWCLVLAKVDTFMNNKKCVRQCERVQQSTAMSSN